MKLTYTMFQLAQKPAIIAYYMLGVFFYQFINLLTMILRRLGSKSAIAKDIIKHFPTHEMYIEPFFGCGGMYFNKPKSKFNILNDLNSDVFNLYQCVINEKDELKNAYYQMPIHTDLLNYWKQNTETEPIKKALRFLTLSNLTLLGMPNNYRFGDRNLKNEFFKVIDKTFDLLHNCQFTNFCFRDLFSKIHLLENKSKVFIYSDPPYIHMTDKRPYGGLVFTKNDFIDLLDTMQKTQCNFAISEFENEFIFDEIEKRKLNLIIIGERKNIKNRKTEILITNYKLNNTLFQ